MEFKNNDLISMSIKDIFNALLPSIIEIYNSVKYLDIPKNVFFEIVLKELLKQKIIIIVINHIVNLLKRE